MFSGFWKWTLVAVGTGCVSLTFGCWGPEPNASSTPQGAGKLDSAATASITSKQSETEKLVSQTNRNEDLVLALSPSLREIAKHLSGKSADLNSVFERQVECSGSIQLKTDGDPKQQSDLVVWRSLPLQTQVENVEPEALFMGWQPGIWSDVKLGVLAGKLDQPDVGALEAGQTFSMKVKLEGRLHIDGKPPMGILATQHLTWKLRDDDQWRVVRWRQAEAKMAFARHSLFQDVTTQLIAEEVLHEKVTRSSHEDMIIERFANSTRLKNANSQFPHFNDWESSFQYPAVSVVDYDQDGWDDLFVTDRWGAATLLRNQAGQGFVDVTEQTGLLVDRFANCALFVDFDNDGDKDVFIGRTLEPSLYFRNQEGHFVLDDNVNAQLASAKFVVAASVADINRDGLLDIYLSTYCSSSGPRDEWMSDVVRPQEVWKLKKKLDEQNPFLDRPGPPNIILMNGENGFQRARIDALAEQWKNSYQSLWYDVDRDGDQDLYLCNDFSPDVFLRNETKVGSQKPVFTDVTSQVFPGGNMGFGMGASFGDYDRDGKLDLYVSNMYSKAGLRIVEQLGVEVNPRIKVSAKGNFLYHQIEDGVFSQVAGMEDSDQHVAKVGWSFGGQFTDFDNDGRLDLYVPSGFFTPPKALASTTDL